MASVECTLSTAEFKGVDFNPPIGPSIVNGWPAHSMLKSITLLVGLERRIDL